MTHIEGEDAILGELEIEPDPQIIRKPDEDDLDDIREYLAAEKSKAEGVEVHSSTIDVTKWHYPSKGVLSGLLLSEDDMAATHDCVLISGYEPDEDDPEEVGLVYCEDMGVDDVENLSDHAIAVFNVYSTESGCYSCHDDEEKDYSLWRDRLGFYVTFTSYCILQTVAPEVTPSVLYRVFKHRYDSESDGGKAFDKIDYGVVKQTMNQYVARTEACGRQNHSRGWWQNMLYYVQATDEEVLKEAWSGEGSLWAFTRPDRFPIEKAIAALSLSSFPPGSPSGGYGSSTFERLPLELLLKISESMTLKTFLDVLALNRAVRELLLPHGDEISYKAMRSMEPWHFPSHPLETPEGARDEEELNWWKEKWAKDGIDEASIERSAPWLKYRIKCSRDNSMRSRRRIWRTAETIRDVAVELGFIE